MEMMLEAQDMWQALNSAKAIRDFVLAIAPEMVSKEEDKSQSQDSPLL